MHPKSPLIMALEAILNLEMCCSSVMTTWYEKFLLVKLEVVKMHLKQEARGQINLKSLLNQLSKFNKTFLGEKQKTDYTMYKYTKKNKMEKEQPLYNIEDSSSPTTKL